MTDNLNDFFSDNAQWVDDTSAGSSFDAALPPQPPKSRRDMRKRREQQRRRRYVTIIAAAVVVILVVVGGFFGVRMVKHLRQMNANGSQIQIEDYTGSGDKDTTFTVETGQGAAEIWSRRTSSNPNRRSPPQSRPPARRFTRVRTR